MKNKGMRKTVTSAQLRMRMLNFTFDGTTDEVGGFDKYQISEVVDNATGNYTVIFANPFERDCLPVGIASLTEDATFHVEAVDYDRVTIQCKVSGTDADAAFSMIVMGSDGRFDL